MRRSAGLVVLMILLCVPALAQNTSQTKSPSLSGTWRNQYTPNLSDALGHEPGAVLGRHPQDVGVRPAVAPLGPLDCAVVVLDAKAAAPEARR